MGSRRVPGVRRCGYRSRRSPGRGGEVVDGHGAHRGRGEVRLDPRADLRLVGGPAASADAASPAAAEAASPAIAKAAVAEVAGAPVGEVSARAGSAATEAGAGEAAARAAPAAAEAATPARDVVVDLVRGDELLERGEAGRRVGATEAADRHHRDSAGGQFHRGGTVGAVRGRRPLVMGRAGLEQFDERAADRRVSAAEAARGPARAAVTEPAGEAAAAAEPGA